MRCECFDEIISIIFSEVKKQDTNYYEAISIQEILAITLRFLATGHSQIYIGYSFCVGYMKMGIFGPPLWDEDKRLVSCTTDLSNYQQASLNSAILAVYPHQQHANPDYYQRDTQHLNVVVGNI
ncbi:hypothetical protein Btru_073744 [Bulinus truncatus]|nr:hypothetical protein Btru_073744 [Bulinus truncatus]